MTDKKGQSKRQTLWEVFRDNPQLFWGLLLASILLVACILGVIVPYDPIAARGKLPSNLYPSWKAFLGTDASGQSILLLVIKGTQAFFLPGILATGVAFLGGIFLGSFGGYYEKTWGLLSRYISTVINSFPNLILVLLCVSIFGGSMLVIAVSVGVTFIPHISEEIRRKIIQLKAEDFVLAARSQGLSHKRILFLHLLWYHCFPLILRQVVYLWGYLILLETSLNYLGNGLLQTGFSWGKQLVEYKDGLFVGRMWSPIVLVAIIMLTMSGMYFLAEGLQKWGENIGRTSWKEKVSLEEINE